MIHLLLLCCLALSWATPDVYFDLELAETYFKEFMATHNKEYENIEEQNIRFEIFKNNLHVINRQNRESRTARFGINRYADLTMDEFHRLYSGLNFGDKSECMKPNFDSRRTLRGQAPESLDFRKENRVTKVKDQGACGSCWAFSTIGTLEGQYSLKHNELVSFSEQQLVDCDTERNKGCNGGLMSFALMYLKDRGAMKEEDYPYKAQRGECNYCRLKVAANVSKCYEHEVTDENELKQVLYDNGPLAIAIDATDFVNYDNGVLETCHAGRPNHGVLLVGYGKENDEEYWIIKNSWSTTFGEEGYARVKMHINACNLLYFIVSTEVA